MDAKIDKTAFWTGLLLAIFIALATFFGTEISSVKDGFSDAFSPQPGFGDFAQEEVVTVAGESESDVEELTPASYAKVEALVEEQIVPKKQLLEAPLNILLLGDSTMIEGFGPALERLLEENNHTVNRYGVYSSGLTLDAKINWSVAGANYANQHSPDLIISSYGPNDGQTIYDSQGTHTVTSPSWESAYKRRVDKYVDSIFASAGAPEYLLIVGQPMPGTDDFRYKFTKINSVFAKVAEENEQIIYLDSWDRFTDNGNYTSLVADDSGKRAIARYADGVHLTPHGSKILSNLVLQKINTDLIEPN